MNVMGPSENISEEYSRSLAHWVNNALIGWNANDKPTGMKRYTQALRKVHKMQRNVPAQVPFDLMFTSRSVNL